MMRRAFMQLMAKYPGVTLDTETERDGNEIMLDSAAGKVFAANDLHTMVEQFRTGTLSWKPKAFDTMAERLAYGLRDCTNPDCDTCDLARVTSTPETRHE